MTLKTRVFGPDLLTEKVMRRFWAKVTMAPNGCLEWTAAKSPNGYGKFGIGASSVHQAHRISYVWANGTSIPSGLDVDHLCRNRACVSPAHLDAVDRATNIARSTNKAAHALTGTCQRGHDMSLPDAWFTTSGGFRGCRLCRNLNAMSHSKKRAVMDARTSAAVSGAPATPPTRSESARETGQGPGEEDDVSQSRKHRGLRSQKVVAEWFRDSGFIYAESAGAGRSGSDLTGTPGIRVEVKARRAFSPLAWLKQAKDAPGKGLPFVVFRCDGQGEANVGDWGVLLSLETMTGLLKEAGYFPESP